MTGTRDYFFPAKIQNRVQIKTRGKERDGERAAATALSPIPLPVLYTHTITRSPNLVVCSFCCTARDDLPDYDCTRGRGSSFPLTPPHSAGCGTSRERDVEEGGKGKEREGAASVYVP